MDAIEALAKALGHLKGRPVLALHVRGRLMVGGPAATCVQSAGVSPQSDAGDPHSDARVPQATALEELSKAIGDKPKLPIPKVDSVSEDGKPKASKGAGKGSGDGLPGLGEPQQAVKPPSRPHSRRMWETLLYWIDKTGTKNVRLQDVMYYATDGEIGQIIEVLKDQGNRNAALEQFVQASKGEISGGLYLEKLGDGSYRARPAWEEEGEDGEEGDAESGPGPGGGKGEEVKEADVEEAKPDNRKWYQRLADGIEKIRAKAAK